MPDLAPEVLHAHLLARAPRILRFDPEDYFPEWQSAVRRSFKQILGLMPAPVPPQMQILSDTRIPAPIPHRELRFLFTSEPRVQVPCTLLLPDNAGQPIPTLIYLNDDRQRRAGAPLPRDIAPRDQTLQHGHAALLMDLRGSGERSGDCENNHAHTALAALLLGRTMMGENVCDITRLIDVLISDFPQLDSARIAILGGALAYYAAAVDPRVAAVIAAGGITTYASSLGTLDHAADQYLPNILHYFDMSDLAGLIVPRPLLIIAGENDPLVPFGGVRECYSEIAEIYNSQQASSACRLVAHVPELFPALDAMFAKDRRP